MSGGTKEKRFLDALESLFTGAEVEGDSGFVNLMRMKRGYFRSIRPKLLAEIDKRAEQGSRFREELFDKLYTFFHRYFCESGSIYFRHLPAFSKIYERVYADGQDVALSWKTQMLYYVKSDVLVRSMPVELNDEDKPQNTRRFYFDASQVAHKKNNEKREFVFAFGQIKNGNAGKVIHLKVSYSQKGTKTKTDEIIKQSRGAGISLTDEQLQKAIGVFRRQTEADFFINKNARGFLREQFDLWVYQYIFQEETIFEEKRIKQIQAIKDTAYDIIDFIAQFEDELRHVWEKPKFVRNVNYVVTIDKLADGVLKKIIKHKEVKKQIAEWRELGMVGDRFLIKEILIEQKNTGNKKSANRNRKFLPLDTKHFKDLELEILDGLGNLDEVLDGELVHSENWQALNTLQKRYRERVKCIYIDPPYNTTASEILYKNTYKHSSWMAMMADRCSLAHKIICNDGILACAIDDEEIFNLKPVLDSIFHPSNLIAPLVFESNPRGRTTNAFFATCHDYLLIYNKNILCASVHKIDLTEEQKAEYRHTDSLSAYRLLPFRRSGGLSTPEERPNSFYPIFYDIHTQKIETSYFKNARKIEPLDKKGQKRVWRQTKPSFMKAVQNGDIVIKQSKKGDFVIYMKDRLKDGRKPKTIFSAPKYDASSHGTVLLANILGEKKFSYPKSLSAVQDIIYLLTKDKNQMIVGDFYAGSGTTAHAVINLNREDGGNRKYLLIEMGEYFHTVLLPRIKKVVYSKDWKDGKPVSHEGSSHFLKYYTLEEYEETLRNSRYKDGEQLELDSVKSPFEQYVFFGDDKLAHIIKPSENGSLDINLQYLYPDIDTAESLSNILGKQIRKRTADSVIFEDGTTEKTDTATMTAEEKQRFVSLVKPYLWWGE